MKAVIEYPDFEKLDLRVGVILEAVAPEWSRKLLQFKVDFGPELGERTIMSGVRTWYDPSQFVGKRYPFIVNLAERKMGEGVSQGMMLMVDSVDESGGEKPAPIPLPDDIPAGTNIR